MPKKTTTSGTSPERPRFGGCAAALAALVLTLGGCAPDNEVDTPYLGANHVPESRRGWEKLQTVPDPEAPMDEAKGGKTARGTSITARLPECFPAETRNVFSEVDKVFDSTTKTLQPFNYTDGKAVTPEGRDAIRGQNTWMLWGEGNEAFWGWLQEQGYGLVDFLVLLDSRHRDTRFQRAGMINQPGMRSSQRQNLGLYLDEADDQGFTLKAPPSDIDKTTGAATLPPAHPPKTEQCNRCHANGKAQLFEVGDTEMYSKALQQLPQDGVDPSVYGYPSGVLGLRLFPNPDFFGKGEPQKNARNYWIKQTKGDAYYDLKSGIQQDPDLVRPFRVSMSCAFCHLGPHPLDPPVDPEHPEWHNLSSTIGNQYWSPQPLFANLTQEGSILYQFLKSQQPGTVDTSLVSTDHINNANTITAVFDIDARLARASANQAEDQSAANLLSPIARLPFPLAVEHGEKETPRHTPRALLDGADSIGAFGALSRVYLNIGTFPEEWQRCHNPIIGFKPQRPFPLATLQGNSVYWQTSEQYRIPYLAAFFTYTSRTSGRSIVAPMKLADVKEPSNVLERDSGSATAGRAVFLQACAICHSSKQPDGFELRFNSKWREAPAPATNEPARFTLPTAFVEWEEFKQSAPYREYLRRLKDVTDHDRGYFQDNFLSTDTRIPITLVGTNSGRAVGTNGMSGQVWDNFSSESYKSLPAVGAVRFYNPFSHRHPDEWGNNDEYYPPKGGPGYYRPASLISLWATAPYLHNNSLGLYPQTRDDKGNETPDPSVAGRLSAFEDGIDKLFSSASERAGLAASNPKRIYGDLRGSELDGVVSSDPGFIYRIPVEASISFPAKFTRPLIEGILGPTATSIASRYVWILLTLGTLLLAFSARPRHAAFFILLVFLGSTGLIVLTRFDRLWGWLWVIPLLTLGMASYLWLARPSQVWSRVIFVLFALTFATTGVVVDRFVDGKLGRVNIEHIPKGTPINLLMNINPEAPVPNLVRAVAGLTRGLVLSQRAKLGAAHATDAKVLEIFQNEAGQPMLEASKCPDFVLDRGHWFAKDLTEEDKKQLKAFLRTL